jgi:hypothetical protein
VTASLKGLVVACALAIGLGFTSAAVAAPQALALHDGDGLQVVSQKQIDPRLVAVVVKTKALPQPANVYVLLPPGYASHPRRRWPVFYRPTGPPRATPRR